MLEFCAAQNIKPQITKIAMGGINDAWSKVVAKQARYRLGMDMNMKAECAVGFCSVRNALRGMKYDKDGDCYRR